MPSQRVTLSGVKRKGLSSWPVIKREASARQLSRYHAIRYVPAVMSSSKKASIRTYGVHETQAAIKGKQLFSRKDNNDETTNYCCHTNIIGESKLPDVVDELVRAVGGTLNGLKIGVRRRTAQPVMTMRHPEVAYIIEERKRPEDKKFQLRGTYDIRVGRKLQNLEPGYFIFSNSLVSLVRNMLWGVYGYVHTRV